MASASSDPTWRPVRMRSLARLGPTSRVSRWVPPPPGMMPSRISGWPNLARVEANRTSQARASSQPPPSAYPLTAATTMRGMAASASRASTNRPPMRAASTGPPNSVISAPAAKMRSPPVTTTAPGGSARSASAAARSSVSSALDRAFTFGWFKRDERDPVVAAARPGPGARIRSLHPRPGRLPVHQPWPGTYRSSPRPGPPSAIAIHSSDAARSRPSDLGFGIGHHRPRSATC